MHSRKKNGSNRPIMRGKMKGGDGHAIRAREGFIESQPVRQHTRDRGGEDLGTGINRAFVNSENAIKPRRL